MDGFEESTQIIVVAATNLVVNIDQALLRPGRFDYKIEMQLPDKNERFNILQIHLRNKTH
jgi:ATP-dependent 26S proteasome regulatory subunit